MSAELLELLQEECFPNMKMYQIEKTFGEFTEDELLEIIQTESLNNG
jgi:hypothetical protein